MGNKYRNKPVVIDGIRFASKAEGNRYLELTLLMRAGKIADLRLQPKYPLHARDGSVACTYIADFEYWDLEGDRKIVTEDVKGVETRDFKIKRKLFEAEYGRPVVLIKSARTNKEAA